MLHNNHINVIRLYLLYDQCSDLLLTNGKHLYVLVFIFNTRY